MGRTGSKLTDFNDARLASLAAAGDQGAFLVLYDRYRTPVTLHVSGFIPIREEVEDVVLESFQKAFSQISAYNPDFRFSTWIFRIARNTAFDHIEKNGRINSNMPMNSIDDADSGLGDIASMSGNPEMEVISSQEFDKVVAAIDSLPLIYRKVARMVLLDNYGYQEVSEALDLPLNTVRTRVKRSRSLLLRRLDEEALEK